MFLDEHLKAGLRLLKEREGIPEAEAVRRAVAEYLEKRGIRIGQAADRTRASRRKRS